MPNQVHQRLVGDDRLRLGQPVILTLLRQDVALGNLHLLRLGVSRNLDDLHAVAQRRRNGVELIRGGNEEHLREIELHFKVVVLEGRVLLRVKHLEKRRRRVAAEVRAELVDLIEHEDGILCSRLLDPLRNSTRERTDVGASVPANLRLVVQATEAHAHELAAHRTSDRLAERRLTNSWRAGEAEDRALHLRGELAHREILNDALLHLLQTVVIVGEHLGRLLDLNAIFGGDVPRHRDQPINVCTNHTNLWRCRRDAAHAVELLECARLNVFGHARGFNLLAQLIRLRLLRILFAKFALDRLELFAQEVFALTLIHLGAHLRLDLPLDLEDLNLS